MTQIDPMNRERAAAVLLQDNILLGLGNLWDRKNGIQKNVCFYFFHSYFWKIKYRGHLIRGGFKKKKKLMEFSIKGPDPPSQHP